MNNFQKITQKLLIVAMLMTTAFVFSSCDDDDEDNLGSLEVKVTLPTGAKIELTGIEVKLLNVTNKLEIEGQTDAQGIVKFKSIPEGTYNLSVDEKKGEISLTGSLAGVLVTSNQTIQKELPLKLGVSNTGLVIKQLYYSGSNEPNYAIMFKDQFIEIYNNSPETIYADGLYIANLFGSSTGYGNDNVGDIVSTQFDITKKVYANWIVQIPGKGKEYPIESGKSIIMAFDAIDFTKEIDNYTDEHTVLNLSKANFETYATPYLEARGKEGFFYDLDNPDVVNVKVQFLSLDACFWDLSGTSAVIFRTDKALSDADVVDFVQKDNSGTTNVKLVGIDVKNIIDGVDFLGNAKAEAYKRLPKTIDESFFYLFAEGDGSLTGKGMLRKKDEDLSTKLGYTVYKDTNNSSLDFEVVKPTI